MPQRDYGQSCHGQTRRLIDRWRTSNNKNTQWIIKYATRRYTNVDSQPAELHSGFSGSGLVYGFEVEDVESEYRRLKKEDIPFVLELRDEPWGQRHFILRDPAGTFVDVVQQLDM